MPFKQTFPTKGRVIKVAENPLIDLAQTVMIEKYNLEEETYSLASFSEGNKTISIKMTDGELPVQAWFPRDFLRYEEMKRWDFTKKELFVKGLLEHGEPLPEELAEDFEFERLYIKLGMGETKSEAKTFDLEAGDRVVLSLKSGDLTVIEGQDKLVDGYEEEVFVTPGVTHSISDDSVVEETPEQFEAKVEGKKRPRKKLVKNK